MDNLTTSMDKPTKIERAFIFDPCLGSMTGHWENYCRRLCDEFLSRNIKVKIFAQLELNASMVQGLSVLPTFGANLYAPIESERAFKKESDLLAIDFSKIDSSQFRAGDLLVFPTLFPQLLKPLFDWLAPIVSAGGPRAAIIFQFPAGATVNWRNYHRPKIFYLAHCLKQGIKFFFKNKNWRQFKSLFFKGLDWDFNPKVAYYLAAAPTLKGKNKDTGYSYFAATQELAKNFSILLDLPVEALPMPGPILDRNHLKPKNSNVYPIIGYYGHAAYAKGGHLLKRIIDRVHLMVGFVPFHVHVNPNKETERYMRVFNKPINQVTSYHGHLSQKELAEKMQLADIILLPYDASKYLTTPSAIFTECLSAGKVLVVPKNTWMERQAKAYSAGHVSFQYFTSRSIAYAVTKAVLHYDTLSKASINASKRFNSYNNVSTYVDLILKE